MECLISNDKRFNPDDMSCISRQRFGIFIDQETGECRRTDYDIFVGYICVKDDSYFISNGKDDKKYRCKLKQLKEGEYKFKDILLK